MDQAQNWLAALSGKKREIAFHVLSGISDQEIADQQNTSIEYVRKTKSDLRAHGYDIHDNRMSRSNGKVSSRGAAGDVNESIVVSDGIAPELANGVYADIHAGMSNQEIAAKHNLRGLQVLALRQECHLMKGCDAFSKMEKEFAS